MSSLRATQLVPRAPRAAASAGRRTLTTASRQGLRTVTARPVVAAASRTVARQFRREYADVAPLKKPGKIRRTFRWVWRLTYLSTLGLFAYVGYTVYEDRHFEDQVEFDPTKKTLVILGTLTHSLVTATS